MHYFITHEVQNMYKKLSKTGYLKKKNGFENIKENKKF